MQKEVERLREDIEALVTQAVQQDEAESAAMGCPPNWPAVRTAWPRSKRPCVDWRPKRRRQQRPNVSAERKPRRNDNGEGRHVEVKRPSRWTRRLRTKRRATVPTPSCL